MTVSNQQYDLMYCPRGASFTVGAQVFTIGAQVFTIGAQVLTFGLSIGN